MKKISYQQIVEKISLLAIEATTCLPDDVLNAMKRAKDKEENKLAQSVLDQCLKNYNIAATEHLPICQDTGTALYFVEIGDQVQIDGGLLNDAINEGTAKGYTDGYLRKSIVSDPLFSRLNSNDNTPAVIHTEVVKGDSLKITIAPKGGGSENMSALAMLKPSDGEDGVVDFVVDSVVNAKGNPCPPTIVGVGIGGTFEKCAFIAKKALLRENVGTPNSDSRYAELEQKILKRINSSGVGPQGLGGSTTALAVHIEFFPCHIASLPVAVNLNCHAARHKTITL